MIDRESIMDVLRTVDDPEMPINIVDLGLVERVQVESANGEDNSASVSIDLLPTFVGCPALDMIRNDVERAVRELPDVGDVHVEFHNDPPWTVDRITEAGRASLQEHGVTVPESGSDIKRPMLEFTPLQLSTVPCPYCGSSETQLESRFGPTRCRMIYYCRACKNSFEHMKRV